MSTRTTVATRALALGVLGVALVALGLPALFGWQLAKVHNRYVQRLAIPGLLEVRSAEFSRGLLRSRSRIRLAPAPAFCGGEPCPAVTVDSVIHHGPIAFTAPPSAAGGLALGRGVIVSHVQLGPLLQELSFEPSLPDLKIITRISLAGAIASNAELPGARLLAHSTQAGGRLNFEPLRASTQLPASYDSMHGVLAWPDFDWVADAGGQLGWQGLTAQLDGAAATPIFWRRLEVGLDSLQWVDGQAQSLVMQGLRGTVDDAGSSPGRLAAEFSLRMSRLATHDREYGPVIVEGRAQGLDPAGIGAVLADLRRLRTRRLPPELNLLAANAIYQTTISELLASGPALRITRFLAGTPDGDIAGDLQLALPQIAPGQPVEVADILKRMQLNLSLRLPAPLLRGLIRARLDRRELPVKPATPQDVDAVVKQMANAKLIVALPEEAVYSTEVRIENQNMTVNGKLQEGWQGLLNALTDAGQTAEAKP